MNDKEPLPEEDDQGAISNYHRKARYTCLVVAVIGVIFLFTWFFLVKDQGSTIIGLYCLIPLALLILLNVLFDLTYKKRKDD